MKAKKYSQLMIIALGGNDLSPINNNSIKAPKISKQWKHTANSLKIIAKIIKKYPEKLFLIIHGNGPQVGNILLRSEYCAKHLPILPLDICVANSQGSMGYMLEQLNNDFSINGIKKQITTILTRVSVNKKDPEFSSPSKFIGQNYSKEEAQIKANKNKWKIKFYKKNNFNNDIWRRVVPSPKPCKILDLDNIIYNIRPNILPIVLGGGGIPVCKVEPQIEKNQKIYECNYGINYIQSNKLNTPLNIYTGVEAVIDKDLSAALLGCELVKKYKKNNEKIEIELYIFTGINSLKLNFQKKNEQNIEKLTLIELKEIIKKHPNNFPKGSMGPKVQAAINFLQGGGKKVFITSINSHKKVLDRNAGTCIYTHRESNC